MVNAKKKGLGKGLGALLGGGASALEAKPATLTTASLGEALPDGARLLYLDPRDLRPNPKQPRRVFNEEALEELAASIQHDGVQEPVLVREAGGGFELISGERRVRASILAGLDKVPAVCRPVSDRDMLKLGLIENIQREDLNAIELAQAYRDLISQFGWTQEELSTEVGKKRATVTNMLRLLSLPDAVQDLVGDGSLSMGHARAILAIEQPQAQAAAARKVIREGLSVRQTEQLAARTKTLPKKEKSVADIQLSHLEDDLRRSLGTRVRLTAHEDGRGKIEIEFFSADERERLLDLLRGKTSMKNSAGL